MIGAIERNGLHPSLAPQHSAIAALDRLADVLADALLASYLLGVDQVKTTPIVEFADPVQLGFDVEPREAVEYFKKKRVVTRKQFDKLADDARNASFTVSGVYKKDVLQGFKDEIASALEQGTAQKKVIQRFRQILSGTKGQKMLGAFHLETVFRTNMQVAYGTGRRRALEDVAEDLPWWTYHTAGDDRVRDSHAALSGVTLRSDHEFWESHYPPWDFACRCSVTASIREPEGYDPQHPSGDQEVSVFYDDAGSPAKAEIQTRVVDLAVGKFKGIPRQGGLQQVIEAGVQRSLRNRRAPQK